MRTAERLRLAATGGRSDVLRIVCTALGAALSALVLLMTATVLAIKDDGMAYYRIRLLNEAGLRAGVVVALLLLTIPVLVFTGVTSRLGSPGRDRRLAAVRLAGATPADVRAVVALETGLAAAAGSVVGGLGFLALRAVVDQTTTRYVSDRRPGSRVTVAIHAWPTDVTPNAPMAVVALLFVPVAATLFALLALRRVELTPFGVAVGEKARVPAVLPAAALVVGSLGVVLFSSVASRIGIRSEAVATTVLWVFVALAIGGLLWGSASMAMLVGRVLSARARGVATLVAGRRLVAHPWEASKVTASIILAVVAGGAAAVLRAVTLLQVADQNAVNGNTDGGQLSFFQQSYDVVYVAVVVGLVLSCLGLLVVQAETVVSRRRALAGLVAAGTPRAVLVRATLIEVLAPLVPMVLVATVVSAGVAAWSYGGLSRESESSALTFGPVPWADLSLLVVVAVGAVVLTTLLSLVTLRAATRPRELRLTA